MIKLVVSYFYILVGIFTLFSFNAYGGGGGPELAAANKAAASLLGTTNAAYDYLYIFSLVAFLMGISSFLPGIRKPGWGITCIIMSIVILSAPSCINRFTLG